MKKIVYLDIWEKGYRNFTRIDDDFVKEGFSTLLVHTGSFYKKETPKEQRLGSLLVRDIRFYNTNLIKNVIKRERPDVIIMLNLSFIFDRAIVNICKSMGIKLVYLSHGKLISPEFVHEEAEKLNTTIWKNSGRVFCKKNLLVLTNYLSSLKGFHILTNPLRLILGIMRKPSSFLTFPKYTEELEANLMLVYSDQDKELLATNFGFPEKRIKVVGNPEITSFMRAPSLSKGSFLQQIGLNETCNYAVYLDDGLVCDKMVTAEQWQENLSEIVQITDSLGLKLIIKLHPRTNREDYLSFFESRKIVSINDCDFKNLLEHAEFVISHLSTTIIYALLFNKNVFIPYWGIFADLCKNYPEEIVNYCTSTSELYNKALVNQNEKTVQIKKYLLDNGIDLKENSIKKIICEVSNIL